MNYPPLKLLIVLLACLLLQVNTCDRQDDPMPIRIENERFVLITDTHLSTADEIGEVLTHAEALYPKIIQVLGVDRTPQHKITIRMEGAFVEQGPYFDNLGIHLFRYSPREQGYLAALAHEMVHAFREAYYIEYDPWSWANYPYLDEGLAEYVAQLVDSSKTGFPLYGFDEYAVVGDMVLSERWIPHDTLRARHYEINDRCNLQAYPQRSTWVHYLDGTYGRDTLLRLNYPETEPTEDFFLATLGVDLNTVDTAWRSWIIQQYNSTAEAAEIAAAFRASNTWYTYCNY